MKSISKYMICLVLWGAPKSHADPADTANEHMSYLVSQGMCEQTWALNQEDYRWLPLSDASDLKTFLLAAPCSQWALNMNWKLFFVSPGANGQSLVRPLSFIRYKPELGLYADEFVSNILFDHETLILTSRYFGHHSQTCGEISGYRWDSARQRFELVGLIKSDDCGVSDPIWEKFEIKPVPLEASSEALRPEGIR